MDINYNLQILYSNDHQRQIMSRWVDQTITTFSVCTRLDQAGSDWERTACLCLRAKENLLLLRSKKKKCLGGNRDKPTYRSPNYYSWKTPLIQKVTNPPQSLVVWSFLSATKHHKDIFGVCLGHEVKHLTVHKTKLSEGHGVSWYLWHVYA